MSDSCLGWSLGSSPDSDFSSPVALPYHPLARVGWSKKEILFSS
jgi:hypothetical protein